MNNPISLSKVVLERLKTKIRINNYKKQDIIVDPSVRIYDETEFGIFAENGRIEIGKGSCIRGSLIIDRPNGQIVVGEKCYIGTGTKIWASENIKIGNHVLIAHNCNIFDNDTHPTDYLERREDAENIIFMAKREHFPSLKTGQITIKDDAWIGCNSIVLKGVTVGEGAIVAAGSVVTQDVMPWTVVAGNPAKVVKNIKNESFDHGRETQ